MKDQLYMLRPGFQTASGGPLYCSDTVVVEGMLSFFPDLRGLLDVHYLEFPKPRRPLVDALGEEFQSLPVLILAKDRAIVSDAPEPQIANGKRYFADEKAIRLYLSTQYDLPKAS